MAAAPRIMPAQPRSDAPGFDQVDVDTCYWNAELPDLGLVNDLRLPYFIYILACEPRSWSGPKTMYVGIAKRSQIARRIQTDAGQGPSAPHFCQTYKPQYILGVWPAASRAAEAMAFYALVAKRSERFLACGSLGGWTQTSTDLSKGVDFNWNIAAEPFVPACIATCNAVLEALVTPVGIVDGVRVLEKVPVPVIDELLDDDLLYYMRPRITTYCFRLFHSESVISESEYDCDDDFYDDYDDYF